jgi:hypothetical protein
MNVETEVAVKLAKLKNSVDGDLHDLVVKLESIFQHITNSHSEDVVKAAVVADVAVAASHVKTIADTVRADADTADQVIDTVDSAVDNVVGK